MPKGKSQSFQMSLKLVDPCVLDYLKHLMHVKQIEFHSIILLLSNQNTLSIGPTYLLLTAIRNAIQ